MAIRRVSDLPDLTTIYRTDFDTQAASLSNFGKCLLEVSYDHIGSIYQSFSTKASDIFKTLCAALSVDFVTVNGDQTITGKKTFTNSGGIVIRADTTTGHTGTVRGITQLSNDIKICNQDLIPSPKAVHDYISASCLPIDALGDLTSLPDTVEMLKSLIHPDNAYYYVNHQDGSKDRFDDANWGTSPTSAFYTLSAAVKKMNQRRFIENAEAYIRIINDYTPNGAVDPTIYKENDKPWQINIYHPDMIQNRKVHIQGWNSDNNSYSQRVISASMMSSDVNTGWLECKCNVSFECLTFDNNISLGYAKNSGIISSTYPYDLSTNALTSYTIHATDNIGSIRIENCYFKNCFYAIVANIINTYGINRFYSCMIALYCTNPGLGRCSINNSLAITECLYGIRSSSNGVVRLRQSSNISYILIAAVRSAFDVNTGGSLNIVIDKKDILSSNSNVLNNTHCFTITHATSPNKYKYVLQEGDTINNDIIKYAFGNNAIGYSNHGFVAFDYPSLPILSDYLNNRPDTDVVSSNISSQVVIGDNNLGFINNVYNNRTFFPDPDVSLNISQGD